MLRNAALGSRFQRMTGWCEAACGTIRPSSLGSGSTSTRRRTARNPQGEIEGERRWVVERAGVQPDPADAFPPRQGERRRHQPASFSAPRHGGHETEERDLARTSLPEIEFDDALPVRARIELYLWIVQDGRQRLVREREAREPEPVLADLAKQRAVGIQVRVAPPDQRRGRPGVGGRRRHLQVGDDGGDMPCRHVQHHGGSSCEETASGWPVRRRSTVSSFRPSS